jgi:polyhydroxyalkanoate synthase subunit PhaC
MTKPAEGHYVDPDWLAAAPRKDGSWWPEWAAWLNGYSGAPIDQERPTVLASGVPSLGPAPGTYVLQP